MPLTNDVKSTLVMTTSLKGGTGKSFFACALLDNLRTREYPVAAYDGDGSIGTLTAMHATREHDGKLTPEQDPLSGVAAYNIRNQERTTLITSAEGHEGLILHDLAGGAFADLMRIFDDEGGLENMFQAFVDLEIHPIFCHLITSDKSTVDSAAYHLDITEQLGQLGEIATHIAVLNQRGKLKDTDFPFWYGFKNKDGGMTGGKTRKRLLKSGGIEMTLPHIKERTLALTKNQNVPFANAIYNTELNSVERQTIRQFVKAFDEAMTPEILTALGVRNA